MAEWGTDMLFRLAGRLGQVLSPRPASAEVIKADEGTYTLTGEDVERFRALIGTMMRSRYRATPEPTPSAVAPAPAAKTPEPAKPAKPQASFPDAYWNAIIEDVIRTRGPSDELPTPNPHDPPEVRAVDEMYERLSAVEWLLQQPRGRETGLESDALLDYYDRLQSQYRDVLETYRERYPEEYEREQREQGNAVPAEVPYGRVLRR